ncbi:MAG: hypothetical protein MUF38_05625 [Anaerolineae bacterium]|nr:hypothetical protein [Anaerolineae bacterium]
MSKHQTPWARRSALRWLTLTTFLCLLLATSFVDARDYRYLERISISSTGVETRNAASPVMNSDGSIVAFWTDTGGLVPGDTNFAGDVFIRNRTNNTTERVSLGLGGVQTARTDNNLPTSYPQIGIDDSGNFIVYASDATNIEAPGVDTNNVVDVFLFNRFDRTTRKVSFGAPGSSNPQALGGSTNPTISGNGNFVAFRSVAPNIVNGDTNNQPDVFVWDRVANVSTRINVSSAGVQANVEDGSSDFTLSDDGRYVAFESLATNLTRINIGLGGAQANADSSEPFISGSGNFVVFKSLASNLVAGDTNGVADIFIWRRSDGNISRVSVTSAGLEANGPSATPVTNDNGRFIQFWSTATNLVEGDTNGFPDFFLHDRITGATTRINNNTSGQQSNGYQTQGSTISDNGAIVAFESFATNLAANDTNNSTDIFVAVGGPAAPFNVTVTNRTETSVSIAWSQDDSVIGAVTQESNFIVQERVVGAGGFRNIATLPADSSTFTSTGLPAGSLQPCTELRYRIVATRDYGAGVGVINSSSVVLSTKTLGCPPGIFNTSAPVNEDTIINPARMMFTWSPSEEAITYTLRVNRTAGGTLGEVFNTTVNHIDVCLATCTYTPNSTLEAALTNGTYTWTLVATNPRGSTGANNPTLGNPATTPLTFFVNDTAIPRNFNLLTPTNDALIRNPDDFGGLTWRDNTDADTFNLSVIQVSSNTRLGSIINLTGLTYQNDSDGLTCDTTTGICTYAPTTAETDLMVTGTYAWTVVAVTPGGTMREARNGAGRFIVRTNDIPLLANGSFEQQGAAPKRAANWNVLAGFLQQDRRVCYPATGTAQDGLCIWRATSSVDKNVTLGQKLADPVGLIAGDRLVLSGFAQTNALVGKVRIKVSVLYVNSGTTPTTATITIPTGTSVGYINLPDANVNVAGPVREIQITVINRARGGSVFLDNVTLTLLGSNSPRNLRPLPPLNQDNEGGSDLLPMPEAPDGFRLGGASN